MLMPMSGRIMLLVLAALDFIFSFFCETFLFPSAWRGVGWIMDHVVFSGADSEGRMKLKLAKWEKKGKHHRIIEDYFKS
jgi:hypothetical protein